jgi:twinkle protein
MGRCVEKLSHSCGTGDGLQVFEDDNGKYNGFCFACGTHVPNPYTDPEYKPPVAKRKDPEDIAKEIVEIGEFPIGLALPSRSLKAPYLEYFGYRFGVNRSDGTTPEVVYRPAYSSNTGELLGYSAKILATKQSWWVWNSDDVDLFGWEKAIETGAKKLFITEGPEDMVALFQAMKENAIGTKYAEYNPAVVSLTHGAGSAVKQLSRLRSKIERYFKEVILVFDMDEPGRAAAEEVVKKVFPNAMVADLPEKDANDCVKAGKSKQLFNATQFQSSTPKNSRLVVASSLHTLAKKPAEWGYKWPWEKLTELTRGIRLGETIYLGAGQKQGKSEAVNTLIAHCINALGWKVLAAKPEEANVKTYKMVAGKLVGRIFHDPKIEFDEELFDKAGELIGDKLFLVNVYQHLSWEALRADIIAAAAEGVKAVFIDPITCLVNGMDAASANTKLQEIAQDLSAMALDLNIVIFISCHLKNPETGVPHERGGKVLSGQFAGSRAMARSCNLMLGLEGNRDPELDITERNMRKLVVLENRETGDVGFVDLYYDDKVGMFNEVN